ncbi:hypothetical protein HLV35_00055 [Eggerthellaceae bacterium zg-997]|nr:hypothetical protein [Eggerthellaceae bacterium zg-997]
MGTVIAIDQVSTVRELVQRANLAETPLVLLENDVEVLVALSPRALEYLLFDPALRRVPH